MKKKDEQILNKISLLELKKSSKNNIIDSLFEEAEAEEIMDIDEFLIEEE